MQGTSTPTRQRYSRVVRTLIHGGCIVTTEGETRADLVIDDRTIVALLSDSSAIDADITIDATGLLILPGLVATHFPVPWLHDIEAGTVAHTVQVAALAGGITTIAAEPGVSPTDVGTPSYLSVDAALWLPVTGKTIPTSHQLARMKDIGLIGVSATLIGEAGLTDTELYQLMRALARHDVTLAIQPLHGEIPAREPISESLATSTIMLMAEETGATVHVYGLTTADAVQIAMDARERGVHVTTGVSTLHLVTAAESGRKPRVRPPLRSQRNVDDLWPMVLAGNVDSVGVTAIRSGEAGLLTDAQTVLSSFWHEAVVRRGMKPVQAVSMLATNPARSLGLFPRKGTVQVGSDADLLLFDQAAEWTAVNDDALDGSGLCPIHGNELTGMLVRTLRAGRTVYDAEHHGDDSLVIPGTGTLLHRL